MNCITLGNPGVWRRMVGTLCILLSAGVMFPVMGADLLPVFKSGDFSENFAVYHHKNFDAVISKKGRLTIQPKAEGKYRGDAFNAFHYALQYPEEVAYERPRERVIRPGESKPARKGTRTAWRNRTIVSLERKNAVGESKPVKQPENLTLKGETENGTRFTLVYKFKENAVSYGIGMREAPNAEKPTRVRWNIDIPRTHDFSNAQDQAKREKVLADCLLVTKPRGESGKVRHDYASVFFFDENPLEEVLVRGPWGTRKLRVEAKRFGKHRFWGRAPSGGDKWGCPWEGFDLHFRLNREEVTIHPQYKIKLAIE